MAEAPRGVCFDARLERGEHAEYVRKTTVQVGALQVPSHYGGEYRQGPAGIEVTGGEPCLAVMKVEPSRSKLAGTGRPGRVPWRAGEGEVKHRLSTMAALLALALAAGSAAQELAPVALPAPQTDGGKPLMQALKLRATARAFAPDPLPEQTLSNLLWAAWGINRPLEGKRTAPSARNWQEIDVLVLNATGAYVYDAKAHALNPLAAGDLRALAGTQDFVKDAPLNLVYVADTTRMQSGSDVQPIAYADAAFIAENVYLFCASEGLATVVRASVDRPAFARALKLRESQLVALAQTVGLPRK